MKLLSRAHLFAYFFLMHYIMVSYRSLKRFAMKILEGPVLPEKWNIVKCGREGCVRKMLIAKTDVQGLHGYGQFISPRFYVECPVCKSRICLKNLPQDVERSALRKAKHFLV